MGGDLEALTDPQDREYVATIADPGERAVVLSTLLRYRVAERLAEGDPVPAVALTRLEPYGTVRLDELVDDRPVMLVFGSYT